MNYKLNLLSLLAEPFWSYFGVLFYQSPLLTAVLSFHFLLTMQWARQEIVMLHRRLASIGVTIVSQCWIHPGWCHVLKTIYYLGSSSWNYSHRNHSNTDRLQCSLALAHSAKDKGSWHLQNNKCFIRYDAFLMQCMTGLTACKTCMRETQCFASLKVFNNAVERKAILCIHMLAF